MAPERSPRDHSAPRPVVLVPIKDFRQAKNRLATRLGPDERQSLARDMATRVVAAAHGHDVRVVCNDEEVAEWAQAHGASVAWVEASGLNPAITEAVARLEPDIEQVLIAHADLPHATTLEGIAVPGRVTIIPDRHRDGTNVMSIPVGVGFEFHYGPGSLHAHVAEGLARGLDVELRQIAELQWDVDTPHDLDDRIGEAPA